ncbi:hypothetical protein F2Q69_00043383 [Brassica cretica]|uniref:Secreted protein n=1 Tax=Brassica cretica TaxID=69181 RepID=A0A8S9NP07_BRACR|nr:hypothetical protein F2Q69_00043383 [Brassica cretica]
MAVSGYLWLRMMVVASSTVWRVVASATSSEDGGGGEEGGDGGEEVGSGGVGERSGDGGSGHLGLLSKDMMMYMMQLGQPTTTIDLATPSPPSASSVHNDEDGLSVDKDESNMFSFRSSSRVLVVSC